MPVSALTVLFWPPKAVATVAMLPPRPNPLVAETVLLSPIEVATVPMFSTPIELAEIVLLLLNNALETLPILPAPKALAVTLFSLPNAVATVPRLPPAPLASALT